MWQLTLPFLSAFLVTAAAAGNHRNQAGPPIAGLKCDGIDLVPILSPKAEAAYNEMSDENKHGYLVFRLNQRNNELVVAESGGPEANFEEFVESFGKGEENDECRYGVFGFVGSGKPPGAKPPFILNCSVASPNYEEFNCAIPELKELSGKEITRVALSMNLKYASTIKKLKKEAGVPE